MGYIIYTDGACKTTDKTGGWCFILIKDDEQVAMEWMPENDTTNNRMEIRACIKGLEYCMLNGIRNVTIRTDSQYTIGAASLGWKRNTNQDILEELDILTKTIGVTWEHVKGHAGDKWNERCDTFAVAASNYNRR